ncbi:hypothetical protein ACFFX0_15955 [Citricoccus parietis]|uniref:Uncharacterized protein n=1 Tax=Citricoccus parietis TaxID=592307 RepID=A0ABV5G100_9MICC
MVGDGRRRRGAGWPGAPPVPQWPARPWPAATVRRRRGATGTSPRRGGGRPSPAGRQATGPGRSRSRPAIPGQGRRAGAAAGGWCRGRSRAVR